MSKQDPWDKVIQKYKEKCGEGDPNVIEIPNVGFLFVLPKHTAEHLIWKYYKKSENETHLNANKPT